MDLKCVICFRTFTEITKLLQHIRLWHFRSSRENLSLKCCNNQCASTFNTYCGYKKHLVKCIIKPSVNVLCRNDDFIDECTNAEVYRNTICSITSEDSNINPSDQSEGNGDPHPSDLNERTHGMSVETIASDISVHIISFISKLMSMGMPLSTIVTVVDNVDELMNCVFEDTLDILSQNDNQNCNIFFNTITASIQKYNSVYKIKKFFSNSVVTPVEVAVGVRSDQILHKASNTYIEKNVTDTFTYIPILNTLSALLQNENIQQYFTRDYGSLVKSDHFETFFDSDSYKKNPLFKENPNAILIQLYFDEFECTAPLGSKTGIHKIGAFYFNIRNIPTMYLGQLDNIHVAALFYSSDLKKYSINKFLQPLVSDLKILERDGIEVSFLPYKLKGTLVALSFDNLGGNALMGMVESFSANYFCRMCLMHKSDTQVIFNESDPLCRARNQEFFNTLPEIEVGSNYYGIKAKSVLNELQYFNLGNISSVDIMHDILEGVAQFEIKSILSYLVSKKIISLNEVNQRIFFFNYGSIDQCTKPSPVNIEKSGANIGERAAQTWTLVRYLPLILIDVIPKCDERWNIITLLLEIMNISFAPIIPVAMTYVLENLICKHHHLVKQYIGNILPKHHMMIHYPQAIRNMGPLIHLWAMRFESKHGYFKDLVNKGKNFKNLPQTLSIRHQIKQSINTHKLYKLHMTFGPVKHFDLSNYEFKDVIIEELDVPNSVTLNETRFLKCGFHYKPSFLVCVKVNGQLPIFQEIIKIILIDEQPFFITKSWETKEFKESLNAFLIKPSIEISICDPKLLVYKEPYECKTVSSSYYIVPKHIFVQI
ncbi:uncharacterized protein LOC116164880 [Photinus pyralis]|nr:uncharacterized protein LOC116164880 [Photinus pyralis]